MNPTNNKYFRWYCSLIDAARTRLEPVIGERHHVVPRALGGDAADVVALTYREHFLAHWLLTKFTSGEARRKMLHALGFFRDGRRVLSSWRYAVARHAHAMAQRGAKRSADARARMGEAARRNATPERMAAMARRLRGHKHTDESRANISAAKRGSNNPMYGKPVSEATREKKRAASTGHQHSAASKEKVRVARTGSKASPETRAKMRASRQAYLASREQTLWTA